MGVLHIRRGSRCYNWSLSGDVDRHDIGGKLGRIYCAHGLDGSVAHVHIHNRTARAGSTILHCADCVSIALESPYGMLYMIPVNACEIHGNSTV